MSCVSEWGSSFPFPTTNLLITRDVAVESCDCKWPECGEKAESRWLKVSGREAGVPSEVYVSSC